MSSALDEYGAMVASKSTAGIADLEDHCAIRRINHAGMPSGLVQVAYSLQWFLPGVLWKPMLILLPLALICADAWWPCGRMRHLAVAALVGFGCWQRLADDVEGGQARLVTSGAATGAFGIMQCLNMVGLMIGMVLSGKLLQQTFSRQNWIYVVMALAAGASYGGRLAAGALGAVPGGGGSGRVRPLMDQADVAVWLR